MRITKRISISLDEELYNKVREYAEKNRIFKFSTAIRILLSKALEEARKE